MAPKSNGMVLPHFTCVLCRAFESFRVGFKEPKVQGFIWRCYSGVSEELLPKYFVQQVGFHFLRCILCLILVSRSFSVTGVSTQRVRESHLYRSQTHKWKKKVLNMNFSLKSVFGSVFFMVAIGLPYLVYNRIEWCVCSASL